MTLSRCFLYCLTFLTILGVHVAHAETEVSSIAVFPLKGRFEGLTVKDDANETIQGVLTDALIKSRRFNIIERDQINKIVSEQKFQSSGVVDENTAVAFGKFAGASHIVLGSYDISIKKKMANRLIYKTSVYTAKGEINIRIVDVKTGKIKETARVRVRAAEGDEARAYEKMKEEIIVRLDREIANKYPLTAFIVKILGEKEVLADIGKNDGITENTEFSVFEYGEDVVHPVTRKVMKGEKIYIMDAKVKSAAKDSAILTLSGEAKAVRVGFAIETKPVQAGIVESISDWYND